jgi:hypothetical protein
MVELHPIFVRLFRHRRAAGRSPWLPGLQSTGVQRRSKSLLKDIDAESPIASKAQSGFATHMSLLRRKWQG